MCGIAGILGDFPQEQLNSALRRMLKVQIHRGPDDDGMEVIHEGDRAIALGSRRLAIQDLSPLGHQPMVNPDTRDVLVYNGEIYNSPELRRELEAMDVRFRGHSDTEVVLRGYERWHNQLLDKLRGMFAFALWHRSSRRLILARDHVGIKPLYYVELAKGFLFASEIKSLLASGLVAHLIDRQALAGYLAYGAVQEPLSIIRNVFVLAPGSFVQIDLTGKVIAKTTYWNIPLPERNGHLGDCKGLVHEGRALLERSLKRHLLSDVPVGVFLSSGLDSTAVAALAQRVSNSEVHAFTVSFPDDAALDEAPVAKQAANRLGAIYHECPVDSKTCLKWVFDGLDAMDQPAMDGLNTYMVSRAVHEQGIVVALSGQGGDEVFGGYRSFRGVPRWYRLMSWLRPLPPAWRALLVKALTIRMASAFREKASDIAFTGRDFLGLYFQYRRLLSDQDMCGLGVRAGDTDLTSSFHLKTADSFRYFVADDFIATVGRLESVFYLRNILLRDGDVFGMANSLEIRVPFLDRDLLDWIFRLPGDLLLPAGKPEKFLLREMCSEFYDQAQIRQAKRGFTPPFDLWLLGPLRELMQDSLQHLKSSGLVEPRGVDQLKEVFLREPRSAAWSRAWALVALGYWLGKQEEFATTVNR